MQANLFKAPSSRPDQGLDVVRITVAIMLLIHSVTRIYNGDVAGFGEFLSSIGFPLGVALAWLITLSTAVASVAMIARLFVVISCIIHAIVLVGGIILDHAADGWFVVGGGRNGVEYSVTLIACLVAVSWSYWPRKGL